MESGHGTLFVIYCLVSNRVELFSGSRIGKGNDVDTLMAKVTIGLGTAFGIITLALAKING